MSARLQSEMIILFRLLNADICCASAIPSPRVSRHIPSLHHLAIACAFLKLKAVVPSPEVVARSVPLVQRLLVAVRSTVAIIMPTHIVMLFARCSERIDVDRRVRKVREVVQEMMAHFCRNRMTGFNR